MRRYCVCFAIPLLFALLTSNVSASVTGRYVHVLLPDYGRTLSLTEVQVFSGDKNVALKKKTVARHAFGDGGPELVVDGKLRSDGKDQAFLLSHRSLRSPAWEVDLGRACSIDKIVLWTPQGMSKRLDGANVLIVSETRKILWGRIVANPGLTVEVLTTAKANVPRLRKTCQPISEPRTKRRKLPRPPEWVLRGEMPAETECGYLSGGLTPPTPINTPASIGHAIADLIATYGEKLPRANEFKRRLAKSNADKAQLEALAGEVLLANPLLDFDKILLVRSRRGVGRLLINWRGNSNIPKKGFDNDIAILDGLDDGKLKTVYKPQKDVFVGDVDLHFDARRMLFSTFGDNGASRVCEVGVDGKGLRMVSPDMGDDVDNYDPCYLADGKIVFVSSAVYTGVPCVGGKDYVGNLFIMDSDGKNVRRLCFEQDNNWYPTSLPSGRVMYLRWEYTDMTHYFNRILMTMNPDGTDQKGLYGSNSYWPNSLFYARPIPGSSTRFVGIVAGHHGTRREGAMVLFDAAKGHHETDGALQIIPGWNKPIANKTLDRLSDSYSQRCLHPYPLSEKLFLAAYRWKGKWAICLFDRFDNVACLKQCDDADLFEPLPLRSTRRPPILPSRVTPGAKEATVQVSNIYEGSGLAGVPKGTVKKLRVYKYEYGPRHKGDHFATGMEATWDVHYVLGTVPVETDGSAFFKVPANTPLALQPLDAKGRALQLMRSWFTAMPGENLACIGCHESPRTAPPARRSIAIRRGPSTITPWRGPARGFSFAREVQPVVDKYCQGCHNGSKRDDGRKIPDFSTPKRAHQGIHPFVRRNGPEGDNHLLTPLEFHANTSELVQMLEKGHHNVKLDNEAWDRINTWIDQQAPFLGTWTEIGADPGILKRRLELRKLYANVDVDPERILNPYRKADNAFVVPKRLAPDIRKPALANWPFDAKAARRMQAEAAKGRPADLTLDMGEDSKGRKVKMQLVLIPSGEFAMGSNTETPQERPVAPVKIDKPFYIGATEVSLQQYRQFEPEYENEVYDMHHKDQVNRGYYMEHPTFPAIRISWLDAMRFCKWLSKKTGKKVGLPTEAQWEWAARAGTNTEFYFGDLNTDFSRYANLSDAKMIEMAAHGSQPLPNPKPDRDFMPKDARFNDGVLHLAPVGKYRPNPWGLHDVCGNIAEWTRSDYAAYPYDAKDGRNASDRTTPKVLRGGSWRDRPFRGSSSYRLGFPPWQRVYNAGFRVVVER